MQGQADPIVNPYIASRMQHMTAPRMQQSAGVNNFPGRTDSLPPNDYHAYNSSLDESKLNWKRGIPKGPNQMPFQALDEGLGDSATRSHYQGQVVDSSSNQDNIQPQEEDMEIGYEDNPAPKTFEGLEKRFLFEIMNLAKEQGDSEDAEITRHKEKIIEINTMYQEKLLALRGHQATRREEFLHKESQARLHQYHQSGRDAHYPKSAVVECMGESNQVTGFQDGGGYSGTSVLASAIEANRNTGSQDARGYSSRSVLASIREPNHAPPGMQDGHGYSSVSVIASYREQNRAAVLQDDWGYRGASVQASIREPNHLQDARGYSGTSVIGSVREPNHTTGLQDDRGYKGALVQASITESNHATGLQDARCYRGAVDLTSAGEPNRGFTSRQIEAEREHSQYLNGVGTQGGDGRVPYPEGRIYNNRSRYNY